MRPCFPSTVAVDITLGLISSLYGLKFSGRSGEAVLPAKHLLDGSITLSRLPAGIGDLESIGTLHTNPLRFRGRIPVMVELYIWSHLLALFAEVSLLLVDHGFSDLFLFNLFTLVSGLGTRSRLKACLE